MPAIPHIHLLQHFTSMVLVSLACGCTVVIAQDERNNRMSIPQLAAYLFELFSRSKSKIVASRRLDNCQSMRYIQGCAHHATVQTSDEH